jgi:hypothetical protein
MAEDVLNRTLETHMDAHPAQDANQIISGLRQVRSRRRRAILGVFAVMFVSVCIADYFPGPLKAVAILPVLVVFVWSVFWFSRAVCPRCGKSFLLSEESLWANSLTHKCMNCGILLTWRSDNNNHGCGEAENDKPDSA